VSADAEIAAMGALAAALDPLDEAAVLRVLRWASDRYAAGHDVKQSSERSASYAAEHEAPSDIHGLFGLARRLRTDQERALLAAFWFQHYQRSDAFTAQQINNELKQMGSGTSNITHVLNRLINQRPALAQQVSKSGRAKQARKRYRLTRAGLDAARTLLSDEASEPA
jgi:hypothetical protein